MKYSEVAKTIIELKNADLALRTELMNAEQMNEGYHPEMEKLHLKNAAVLDDIISQIGYPTETKVGKEGSDAAWLIIQHAISAPAFMERCLTLLKKAVDDGEANPIGLAYLSDRVAVYREKVQLYGTQFDWDENGELNPQPFDNLVEVNRRRKTLGLNTLEEQTEVMRKQAAGENHLSPSDMEERNNKMQEWKKRVGWI